MSYMYFIYGVEAERRTKLTVINQFFFNYYFIRFCDIKLNGFLPSIFVGIRSDGHASIQRALLLTA